MLTKRIILDNILFHSIISFCDSFSVIVQQKGVTVNSSMGKGEYPLTVSYNMFTEERNTRTARKLQGV